MTVDIDLAKTCFSTPYSLLSALSVRRQLLDKTFSEKSNEREQSDLDKQLAEIGIESFCDLDINQLGDEKLIRKIAQVMNLPPDLLVLRAKETLLRDQLRDIENEIDMKSFLAASGEEDSSK